MGLRLGMCSIGGRLRRWGASSGGANVEIPLLFGFGSNLRTSWGTVPDGQFDWGGRLLKGNGGAQRFPPHGWKSCVGGIGLRGRDCETNKSSRDESRAK